MDPLHLPLVTQITQTRRGAHEPTHRVATSARAVAAAIVGLAGLIHLLLAPAHFAEQTLYGVGFTGLGLVQLALAAALLIRPGSSVDRAGIWTSALIALVYAATRLVPPPGATAPEEIEALGVLTTGLELTALVLLTLVLPEPAARPTTRVSAVPAWWGVGGGLITAPLWLIATGMLHWTSAEVRALFFVWYGRQSSITPALAGAPLPHVWLFAPWWTLVSATAMAALVGLNLWQSTRLALGGRASCRLRRASLLTLLPAELSGPLCCGAPLVALLGAPALLSLALAPYATGLSLLLLTAQFGYLSVRFNRAGRGACADPPRITARKDHIA
jgi:hypothetical protein